MSNPIQTRIYVANSAYDLERMLNRDLRNATETEIIDIKYSGSGWHKYAEGTREYSAMVVFRIK